MGHYASDCPEKDTNMGMFAGCIQENAMVDKEDEEWAFVGMALAMQDAEENCEEKSCKHNHTSITIPNQRKKDGNLIGTHVTKINPWHVYPLPSSLKLPSIIGNVNTATVSMMNVAEQSSDG